MNFKKLLVLAIFAIAIVGIIAPINASNIDNNVKIESKTKTSSYKITWNCNSGKIGTKKVVSTTVKKATKIGKLLTPKRSGYTFNGWYTKKTGGTKITKNTVVKKKVTYYAQWKKGNSNTGKNTGSSNRVLNSEEKKLVGKWSSVSGSGYSYDLYTGAYLHAIGIGITQSFNVDGTYSRVVISNTAYSEFASFFKGYWHMSGGTVYLTQQKYQYSNNGGKSWSSWVAASSPNNSFKIIFGSDEEGSYFQEEVDGVKYVKT